ncbi:hypothetical protein N9L68_07400 [bacterium]|nr:hypothetical protein [bacterium]
MARRCRAVGGRAWTDVMVRGMHLAPLVALDGRRLEVVVDGLPFYAGAQLAVDATLVSALRRDGTPRPHAAYEGGIALTYARGKKARTYPELSGANRRARLVVVAGGIGGRWSEETVHFLIQLAKARVRTEPRRAQGQVARAWLYKWLAVLACAAGKEFTSFLLDKRAGLGRGSDLSFSHEVSTGARLVLM